MKGDEMSGSGEVSFTVIPKAKWNKKLSAVKAHGIRIANERRAQGHTSSVEILAPREIHDRKSIPLAAVMIELDWRMGTKLSMVESARDMITSAYTVDSLDPAFPTVLASIIEGRGLYEHGIGEFFLLYGKFEQKYRLGKGKDTRAKMLNLINGDTRYLKPYTERGKTRMDPLPHAVRNILSHVGNNPNTLDTEGNDLRTSIELLRSWI